MNPVRITQMYKQHIKGASSYFWFVSRKKNWIFVLPASMMFIMWLVGYLYILIVLHSPRLVLVFRMVSTDWLMVPCLFPCFEVNRSVIQQRSFSKRLIRNCKMGMVWQRSALKSGLQSFCLHWEQKVCKYFTIILFTYILLRLQATQNFPGERAGGGICNIHS